MSKYPHMFPIDIAVWERFLQKYSEGYIKFDYDIKVGKPVKMFPYWEENYRKDAEILSKFRIDAIGYADDAIDVIEVKPRLNQASVGQILTYTELFLREFKPKLPVTPVIVAGEGNENIVPIAQMYDIEVYLV